MLSKSQIKLITSLKHKKYRQQHALFVAEGVKTISELLDSNLELKVLYTTDPFNIDAKKEVLISENELKRISFLTTPNKALAIFKIPGFKEIDDTRHIIALDSIRDPGNLGTIIRLCDWFGVEHLLCSKETVDCYNPKVIQATMGSITRVNIVYLDLEAFLKSYDGPIYGTYMDGQNVYKQSLPEKGIVVMGNEANGISKTITRLVTHKVAIPRFGDVQATESLNVATAAAVILSEFKRGA
ncbi:TrmH family RNA methyltransferase [Cognatitamlana onchidii]|uniref:TrmH family RNA methyltransferase n=1 Tax=Cognatitamlana onchidii TaxID=2562860 RepID=UPI0010A5A6BE|nr:RNA methyltransferase [Algibacter onchidii]